MIGGGEQKLICLKSLNARILVTKFGNDPLSRKNQSYLNRWLIGNQWLNVDEFGMGDL